MHSDFGMNQTETRPTKITRLPGQFSIYRPPIQAPPTLTKRPPQMREKMEKLVRTKQREFIAYCESIDTVKFRIDEWQRPDDTGCGVTAVIENGTVFERGGINISIVHGIMPEAGIKRMRENHAALKDTSITSIPYWVCGLSLVLHSVNPMAPTIHLNYRYFETQNDDGTPHTWWFGGGSDLTPSYLFEEDAVLFHSNLKQACDTHDPKYYPEFKAWCDRYFVNTHRSETRGVGGIFFDDLISKDAEKIYAFVESCLCTFLPTYSAIMARRKDMPFTPEHVEWQRIRRGRYVEFNLVHDRGTAFGLHTPGARIESIFVTMPLNASWRYDYHPEPGSDEQKLIDVLKSPREWV